MIRESFSEKDTFDIANALARKAQKGDIIALIGDLGAGKTAFTRGFAAGLGITEPVTSPTFTILYHFDVYRIGDVSEMDEIGYEDCFWGDGVSIMEWADLVVPIIPDTAMIITISSDPSKGSDYRKITISKNTPGEDNEDNRD